MIKEIIILVGPKGCGKTYVGTLLREKTGIYFFRVEDIWLSLKSERLSDEYITTGFKLVRQNIDVLLRTHSRIIIESTATSGHFFKFLDSLRSEYAVRLVKIVASPRVCSDRIKSRDSSIHVPVSDDILTIINQASLQANLRYDLVIENEDTSDELIIEQFNKMPYS
jgi:dephospho-CoA kinase